jgi:hypothetical protein
LTGAVVNPTLKGFFVFPATNSENTKSSTVTCNGDLHG